MSQGFKLCELKDVQGPQEHQIGKHERTDAQGDDQTGGIVRRWPKIGNGTSGLSDATSKGNSLRI